jgi:hypothetical protein
MVVRVVMLVAALMAVVVVAMKAVSGRASGSVEKDAVKGVDDRLGCDDSQEGSGNGVPGGRD